MKAIIPIKRDVLCGIGEEGMNQLFRDILDIVVVVAKSFFCIGIITTFGGLALPLTVKIPVLVSTLIILPKWILRECTEG